MDEETRYLKIIWRDVEMQQEEVHFHGQTQKDRDITLGAHGQQQFEKFSVLMIQEQPSNTHWGCGNIYNTVIGTGIMILHMTYSITNKSDM